MIWHSIDQAAPELLADAAKPLKELTLPAS